MLPSCTVLLACLVSTRAVAQSATSLFPDASVLRRNGAAIEMRFSPMRWDAVFGTGLPGSSTRNLAWGFNAESLGVAALPQLTPAQTAIRTLANLPNFQLTAGKLVAVPYHEAYKEPFERAGFPAAWLEWRDNGNAHTSRDTYGRLDSSKVKTTGVLVHRWLWSLTDADLKALVDAR